MIRKLLLVAIPALAVVLLSGNSSEIRSWASSKVSVMKAQAKLIASRYH